MKTKVMFNMNQKCDTCGRKPVNGETGWVGNYDASYMSCPDCVKDALEHLRVKSVEELEMSNYERNQRSSTEMGKTGYTKADLDRSTKSIQILIAMLMTLSLTEKSVNLDLTGLIRS